MTRRTPLLILGLLLLPIPRSHAQEDAPSPPPTAPAAPSQAPASTPPPTLVSERLAEPYTIDLLPDEVDVPLTPDEAPAAPPDGKPAAVAQPWGRRTLRGDLLDRLFSTREAGVTFGGQVTQFGFGLAGGINRPVPAPLGQGDVFKYTGHSEYDLLFDLEKLGGPPKGRLLVRTEQWYGEFGNVSLHAGTFAPPVFPALLPPRLHDPGVPYITNFLYTQPLSKKWVVFVGKKDVLGSFDQDIFAGGDGTDQFVNQAFIANPVFLLGLPYSSFTAGFVSPRPWGAFSAFVLDPKDRTADFMQFGNLFAQGIIVGGEVKAKTMFFDLPGEVHLGGIWKHISQMNLSFGGSPPGEFPEVLARGVPTLRDSYVLYTGFDQYFVRFTEKPDRGWGLFGRAAISDGNPNPVKYFLSTGFGGFSPLGQQRGDTFGAGWYLVGASDQFGPIPRALLGPRNGTGVELFYNYQATPWLNITGDVQWLRPGAGAIADNNAFIYGLRVNVVF